MMIVDKIREYIEPKFSEDASGHDIHHIDRVFRIANFLQSQEGGDAELIALSALLHDISDHKFNGGKLNEGGMVAKKILTEFGYPEERAERVRQIIDTVSYKGARVTTTPDSIEAMIVQDADRLDAIGAIGVARTFAYGGNRNQQMYDPELDPTLHASFEEYANAKSTTINHFYEKLLLLNDRLNTVTAKELGRKRHQYMEEFLHNFYEEWNFNK